MKIAHHLRTHVSNVDTEEKITGKGKSKIKSSTGNLFRTIMEILP